jgi:hypothetical protein
MFMINLIRRFRNKLKTMTPTAQAVILIVIRCIFAFAILAIFRALDFGGLVATLITAVFLVRAFVSAVKFRKEKMAVLNAVKSLLKHLDECDTMRSERIKTLFYNSQRYLSWKSDFDIARSRFHSVKDNKHLVFGAIYFVVATATLVTAWLTPFYIFFLLLTIIFHHLYWLEIENFSGSTAVQYIGAADFSKITDGACPLCAGEIEANIDEAKFKEKTATFENIVLAKIQPPPALSKYDEITSFTESVDPSISTVQYKDGSTSTEQVKTYKNNYTVKRVKYLYEVPFTCKCCGFEWVGEVEGDAPAPAEQNTTVNNISNITNVYEAEKTIPPIYCVYCGGKNKGEATKCEHCSGILAKPSDPAS